MSDSSFENITVTSLNRANRQFSEAVYNLCIALNYESYKVMCVIWVWPS